MLTIERVARLRTIDLFSQTPDYILAAVGNIVEELYLLSGTQFIEDGEDGDSMYLVIDGIVRVSKAGKTLIDLSAGQTVGELAIFDPQPRAADVTVLEDAQLFRIGRNAIEAVMADRPEIALGVIRALCRRIRDQGYAQSKGA